MDTNERIAGVQLPSRELHARFLQHGLTRYGYDEIVETLREAQRAQDAYAVIIEEAFKICAPYDFGIAWQRYAPKHIQDLDVLMNSDLIPVIQLGAKTAKETYPVATWKKAISRYARLIARIRKAIGVCTVAEKTTTP